MLTRLILLLLPIACIAGQCCTGSGPSLPSNTATSCVSSTSGAIPAAWTLLPATGSTSCSASSSSCMAYKCTATAQGLTMTQYSQICSTPALMAAYLSTAQSTMSGSGVNYVCTSVMGSGAQLRPDLLSFLLAVAMVVFVQAVQ